MKIISQWFLALGLVAVLVISACAAPAAPMPSPTSPPTPTLTSPSPGKAEITREQKLIEAAKANGEKEVVLWTMSWYEGSVERAFEAKYPFLKLRVWVGPGATLEPKLLEEYKAGKYTPDVIQQPLDNIVREAAAGVLQEYEWPNVVGWPNQPPTKLYIFHQESTRVPMYNTKLVSPADVPKTWEDLNDPKWRGKAIISISAAGWLVPYTYMIGDFTAEGIKWDRAVNFWKEVVRTTRPTVGVGFAGTLEKLVIGDVSIMLVAAGTTGLELVRKGAPIGFAPLKRIPGDQWTLALTKNPPNPNAARLLLDFLTSEEGALVHAEMSPNPTYHPGAARRAYANRYFASKGMEVVRFPVNIWKPEYSTQSSDFWTKEIVVLR